jgi:hypothetical protein
MVTARARIPHHPAPSSRAALQPSPRKVPPLKWPICGGASKIRHVSHIHSRTSQAPTSHGTNRDDDSPCQHSQGQLLLSHPLSIIAPLTIPHCQVRRRGVGSLKTGYNQWSRSRLLRHDALGRATAHGHSSPHDQSNIVHNRTDAMLTLSMVQWRGLAAFR